MKTITLKDDRDFDVIIDPVRTIDNRRLQTEVLTSLTKREMAAVDEYLKIVLGLAEARPIPHPGDQMQRRG